MHFSGPQWKRHFFSRWLIWRHLIEYMEPQPHALRFSFVGEPKQPKIQVKVDFFIFFIFYFGRAGGGVDNIEEVGSVFEICRKFVEIPAIEQSLGPNLTWSAKDMPIGSSKGLGDDGWVHFNKRSTKCTPQQQTWEELWTSQNFWNYLFWFNLLSLIV